jgi:hypothetical protein
MNATSFPHPLFDLPNPGQKDIPAAALPKTTLDEKESSKIWLASVPLIDHDHIESHIRERTWGKVRFLDVAVTEGGRVVVRGLAPSYYAKQLAIKAVAEVLPPTQPFDVLIEVP